MTRAKNPNQEKAKLMYIESGGEIPLVDIASTLDIPVGTIRSWKSRQKWDNQLGKKNTATLQEEKRNVAPKSKPSNDRRGAPKGNKNAVGNKGGGAPIGNKNRVTTGEFESIFFDSLSEEESTLIQVIDMDKYNLLKHELQLLTVREYRMMKKIEKIKTSTRGLNVKDVTKKKFESKNIPYNIDEDGEDTPESKRNKYVAEETTTHTISDFELLHKLENALTRIQARKIVCINLLSKMEESAERLALEKERISKDSGGDGNIDVLMDTIDAARRQREQRGDSQ